MLLFAKCPGIGGGFVRYEASVLRTGNHRYFSVRRREVVLRERPAPSVCDVGLSLYGEPPLPNQAEIRCTPRRGPLDRREPAAKPCSSPELSAVSAAYPGEGAS